MGIMQTSLAEILREHVTLEVESIDRIIEPNGSRETLPPLKVSPASHTVSRSAALSLTCFSIWQPSRSLFLPQSFRQSGWRDNHAARRPERFASGLQISSHHPGSSKLLHPTNQTTHVPAPLCKTARPSPADSSTSAGSKSRATQPWLPAADSSQLD